MLSEQKSLHSWRVLGATKRGSMHERRGLPNQDDIGWLPEEGESNPTILAVSDGHGSAKCFRSAIGSRSAVESALALLPADWPESDDLSHFSVIQQLAEEKLPKSLVRAWQKAVQEHLDKNPFTDEELETLRDRDGDAAVQMVNENPLLAYGATLLVAIAIERFCLYLQIGDGDILSISRDGAVSRPIPEDERLFANATTSLSSPNAWQDFRFALIRMKETSPTLVMLCTDGYSNSFESEEGFFKAGTDIANLIFDNHWIDVKDELPRWLSETSLMGSGDDITIGILTNVQAGERASELSDNEQGGDNDKSSCT